MDTRTGVMVVTVWRDGDQLRARLRFSDDHVDSATVVTLVGRDAVLDRIQRWLDEVDPPPQ
jgi:hypothetical protein